jgi:hypothetical protein
MSISAYTKPATSVNVEELLVDPGIIAVHASAETEPQPAAKPARGAGKYYRIPKPWHDRLVAIRPKSWSTMVVGLHVYREWCMRRKGEDRAHDCIKVGNAALGQLGVDRHTKLEDLRRLEAAGLITVRRRYKASPEVTVLDGHREASS